MSLFGRLIQIEVGDQSFDSHHIVFDIKKTEFGKEPNPCSVTITNLTSSQYLQINTGQKLIVRAGYLEEFGLEVIFIGDITYVNPVITKPEIRTIIEAGDTENAIRSSKVSISYTPGVQAQQILKDIIESFNLPKKTNLKLFNIANKIYNTGFSFTGSSINALDKVCEYLGLNWSMQNEEVKIYEKFNNDRALLIELTSDSGLIDNPSRVKIAITQVKDTKKIEIDGLIVNCLLQPKAEPGGIISLKDRTGQSKKYKIVTVQHIGDNFSGDFKTILQVMEI